MRESQISNYLVTSQYLENVMKPLGKVSVKFLLNLPGQEKMIAMTRTIAYGIELEEAEAMAKAIRRDNDVGANFFVEYTTKHVF